MEPYKIVEFIMIAFAVLYVIFEFILNYNNIDNDTSNAFLLKWSQGKAFFIPFALGAIGGHLFLGTKNPFFDMNSLLPVAILLALVIIMVIIGIVKPFKKSKLFLGSLLVLGVIYGHLIWSMNIPNL